MTADTEKKEVQITQPFNLHDNKPDRTIHITNNSSRDTTVEDLAIPFFYNNEEVENSKEIFEQRVIGYQFILGNNSFLFRQRPSGVAPYLVMVPSPGTSLNILRQNPSRTPSRCIRHLSIQLTPAGRQRKVGANLLPALTYQRTLARNTALHSGGQRRFLRRQQLYHFARVCT